MDHIERLREAVGNLDFGLRVSEATSTPEVIVDRDDAVVLYALGVAYLSNHDREKINDQT